MWRWERIVVQWLNESDVWDGTVRYLDPRNDRRRVRLRESPMADEMLARKLEQVVESNPDLRVVLEAAERIRDLSALVATLVPMARED